MYSTEPLQLSLHVLPCVVKSNKKSCDSTDDDSKNNQKATWIQNFKKINQYFHLHRGDHMYDFKLF